MVSRIWVLSRNPVNYGMVAWEGYGPEENSWEQFEMLGDTAMHALQQFHQRYPSKPKDHRVIDNSNRGTKTRH